MTNMRNAYTGQGMITDFLAVTTGISKGLVLGNLDFLICILELSIMAEDVKHFMNAEKTDNDVDPSTVCFLDDSIILLATPGHIIMAHGNGARKKPPNMESQL